MLKQLKRRHRTSFNIFYIFLTGLISGMIFGKTSWVTRMTVEEAAAVIASVGFPPTIVPIMTCIASHESSFRTEVLNYNRNHTVDYGFMQVNTIWLRACGATEQSILNVYTNAKCAYHVYKKQGLTAWVTFNKFRSQCLANKIKTPVELTASEQNFLAVQKNQEL